MLHAQDEISSAKIKMIPWVMVLLLAEAVSQPLTLGAQFRSKRGMQEKRELCTSSACMRRARHILSIVDQAADPCEDFFEYACAGKINPRHGGYENADPLAESEILSSVYQSADEGEYFYAKRATPRQGVDAMDHELADFFDSQPIIDVAKNVTEKIIMLYQSCKRGVRREEQEIAALNRVLDEVGFHEWPLFNRTKKGGNKFKTLEELFLQTGIGNLIEVTFRRGLYGERKPILGLESTISAIIPAAKYIGKYEVVLEKLRRNGTREEAEALQNVCLKVTDDLMKVYFGIFNNEYFWETTYAELESNLPSFPVVKILNHFLKDTNMSVRRGDHVLIHKPMVFMDLINYLSKHNLDVIYNCMGMFLAGKILLLFPQKMLPNASEMNASLLEKYHSSLCLSEVEANAPAAMTRLLMLNSENLTAKKREGRALWNKIGKAFYTHLKLLPWLDRETRQGAIKKLWDMTVVVAYSDTIMNETILESLYDTVRELRRNDSLFEIIRLFMKNNQERGFTFFRKGISFPLFIYKYEMFTGRYGTTENAIVAQAAMLHEPFFDTELPVYFNLASVGFIMAHEMGHGYDVDGKAFDGSGRLADWWSNYSREEYNERAQCLLEQYASIVDPTANMSLNGKNTLSENIADNVGIVIAHKAFRTYDVDSVDIALPGLENFTSEQLFFISFAMGWCQTPLKIGFTIKYDSHSPPKYRINVPLQNMEAFSAAFHCKKGSRMRREPSERCIFF